MADHSPFHCSFCGKAQQEVPLMLAGQVRTAICSDCLLAGVDQMVDHARARRLPMQTVMMLHPVDPDHFAGVSPRLDRILARATRAMTLAELNFPQPNYTALKVAEEAGEVVKAAVHYAERRGSWSDVEDEATQAIAMILRLLHEGDAVNGIVPPEDDHD